MGLSFGHDPVVFAETFACEKGTKNSALKSLMEVVA
jgi:hypothetical protein